MAYTLLHLYALLLTSSTILRGIYHDPTSPEEEMKCGGVGAGVQAQLALTVPMAAVLQGQLWSCAGPPPRRSAQDESSGSLGALRKGLWEEPGLHCLEWKLQMLGQNLLSHKHGFLLGKH